MFEQSSYFAIVGYSMPRTFQCRHLLSPLQLFGIVRCCQHAWKKSVLHVLTHNTHAYVSSTE